MKSANPLSDALHVMAHLVGQTAPRTSEQLASCLPTHPVVIRRLLTQLQKAGLVSSARGHGGGSLLARDAAAITLHDIYLAVGAPPLVQVGARDSGGGCPIQQLVNSALLEGAREAQRLLEARLRATTLDQLGADFARHLAHHRSLEGHHES
ncbi:TPA: Rrf2 family transcriptional regulator [Stenotrophomonas maltophilia]|uniref:Rrf2 family transcriptional regulator n=1 Tax=Stenotrophomonas maltophilia TaxID=40324 RepID=UPI002A940CB2|nr:Rrf2 family transcriptional regulator [Stenotrophomonas maltophilia]HEL4113642.1 Rrf2 family transcriptional regulator [Stenotrophomonas maltophilia]